MYLIACRLFYSVLAKNSLFLQIIGSPCADNLYFGNDLSRFLAWILHPRQCLHQLGFEQEKAEEFRII